MNEPLATPLARSWFRAAIEEFLRASDDEVLGQIARNSSFSDVVGQKGAWMYEIQFLKNQLVGLQGTICFEFNVPRMGRRVDAVLVIGAVVFVIEFKVGEREFTQAALEQAWDYALDLKNFHESSHDVTIAPILVATDAPQQEPVLTRDGDNVFRPITSNPEHFREVIDGVLAKNAGEMIDGGRWMGGSYLPTPTIVEAARALYANHSVESIARHDADAQNLAATSKRLEQIVDQAQASQQKVICFVTGVPGAGKTLVGLNLATRRRDEKSLTHAVYLSGNGPLVKVLQEALTRDEVARRKAAKQPAIKGRIKEEVKAFIQNVHHFRDEGLRDGKAPPEHVVIFDEAQRAWNLRKTADFMQRKKGQPGFTMSEPEFLISCLDRHPDWAVIVCLVGGGQEINDGEAGISAWLTAVNGRFACWNVHISSRLSDEEYAAGHAIDAVRDRGSVCFDDALHLAVSMRSFRAENVSRFVKALLDCDSDTARRLYAQIREKYPVRITRDLAQAKKWVRHHARGSERFGLVASSKAQRLKPHAIDVRVEADPVQWFLNERDDTRSSYYLEDAATEFQVQGLEVDWACVSWDGDLRFDDGGWTYHHFRGSQWSRVHKEDNRTYLRNAYRVLLTRARQGMVIFVPCGDDDDPTRRPAFYDGTFRYLSDLGITEI